MAKESTLVGFPYDSRLTGGSYDRAINSPTFRKLILKYFTTGVFPNPSTNLQVFANSGLNVTVKAGYANVNGVFCELKEDITLNLDATSTYSRIDRIVLRHDDSEGVRATKLMILKGTADNNPQPVSLTRNETVYDICLANVTVKTVGIITQAEISDTRLDNNVCGIVTGTIKNVDTTTLYNQIQSDLDQFKENEKNQWDIWFNAIKEELEQIDVGQLTQDIQQIKQNYVPKSDIVNNLTSGGTNKPLSAEQGKLLNLKINEKPKTLWEGSFSSYTQSITLNENIFNFRQIYIICTSGLGMEKGFAFQIPFIIESGKTTIQSSLGIFTGEIRIVALYLDRLSISSNSVYVRGWDWLNNDSNNPIRFNRIVGIR